MKWIRVSNEVSNILDQVATVVPIPISCSAGGFTLPHMVVTLVLATIAACFHYI